jgi:hypothetical protein
VIRANLVAVHPCERRSHLRAELERGSAELDQRETRRAGSDGWAVWLLRGRSTARPLDETSTHGRAR